MNSRDYKIFRAEHYYHVYNRGNNKLPIFLDNQDFLVFLNRIKLSLGLSKVLFGLSQRVPLTPSASRIRIQPFPKNVFSIISYCLMPNHFHFLIRQNSEIPIDKFILKICTSYAKYFNKKYSHIGNVFQDRFKAKIIDSDAYLTYLSAYIHNNPQDPANYDFSSFKDYLNLRPGNLCEKSFILRMFDNNIAKYKEFVLGFNQGYLTKIKDYLFED